MSFKDGVGVEISYVFRPSKSSKSSKELAAAADVEVTWAAELEVNADCDLHKT